MFLNIVSLLICCIQAGHYFKELVKYDHSCNVMDYGAKGDGKTNDTNAIQNAINDCLGHGSSAQIYLPSSHKFLSNTLYITKKCTDCSFYLHSDSTLLASNDRSKWASGQHFIYLENVVNFVFQGPGIIDGQGQAWWPYTNDWRPEIIYAKMSHLIIKDLTVQNCPTHCLELYADYTEVYGILIQNPPGSIGDSEESHNTDGIDVHGQPFYVHDSTINTGDDNVALHANDTLIKNCNFGTGHGASIGSVGGGWLKNITVTNITFDQTVQAMRIKIDYNASPGKLWDVTYSNITVKDVDQAIYVSEYYNGNNNDCKFLIDGVTFENIKGNVANPNKYVGQIDCQPNIKCQNIVLKDIQLTGGKDTWECQNAGVSASSVSPSFKGC